MRYAWLTDCAPIRPWTEPFKNSQGVGWNVEVSVENTTMGKLE